MTSSMAALALIATLVGAGAADAACVARGAIDVAPLAATVDAGKTPAMAMAVIQDGALAGQAACGMRASDGEAPVGLADIWHIGSNAKSMTATMIARLVERRVLAWDTPLTTLLPDVRMRPEFRTVTLADLLSHRAGLRDLDDTADAALLQPAFDDPRPLPVQRLALAAMALNEPPIGPIRAASVYSNSGYVIAAAAAEQATGKSFETLMQEEVFGPLGMTVAYAPSQPGQVLGHEEGKPMTGLRADNPPMIAPAGAVKLTLADWSKFAIDQMAGEAGHGALLSAAGYKALHQAQGDTDAALGWGVLTSWPKETPVRLLTHGGSNGRWMAFIALAPERQAGVLIVANSAAEGVDAAESAIMMSVMRGLLTAKP